MVPEYAVVNAFYQYALVFLRRNTEAADKIFSLLRRILVFNALYVRKFLGREKVDLVVPAIRTANAPM